MGKRQWVSFVYWSVLLAAWIYIFASMIMTWNKPNLLQAELDYYRAAAKTPAFSCHLAGGEWDWFANETVFQGGGYSEDSYTCKIKESIAKDWKMEF